jgi:hypothetical protein
VRLDNGKFKAALYYRYLQLFLATLPKVATTIAIIVTIIITINRTCHAPMDCVKFTTAKLAIIAAVGISSIGGV